MAGIAGVDRDHPAGRSTFSRAIRWFGINYSANKQHRMFRRRMAPCGRGRGLPRPWPTVVRAVLRSASAQRCRTRPQTPNPVDVGQRLSEITWPQPISGISVGAAGCRDTAARCRSDRVVMRLARWKEADATTVHYRKLGFGAGRIGQDSQLTGARVEDLAGMDVFRMSGRGSGVVAASSVQPLRALPARCCCGRDPSQQFRSTYLVR